MVKKILIGFAIVIGIMILLVQCSGSDSTESEDTSEYVQTSGSEDIDVSEGIDNVKD